MSDSEIIEDIMAELQEAERKFPRWPTDPIHAAAIVAEELGELQQAVLNGVYDPRQVGRLSKAKMEALQTAAMCIRFIRSLDRYEWYHSKQHDQEGGAR